MVQYVADYFDTITKDENDMFGVVYGVELYEDSDGTPIAVQVEDLTTCIYVIVRCDTLGKINNPAVDVVTLTKTKVLVCSVEVLDGIIDAWIVVADSQQI